MLVFLNTLGGFITAVVRVTAALEFESALSLGELNCWGCRWGSRGGCRGVVCRGVVRRGVDNKGVVCRGVDNKGVGRGRRHRCHLRWSAILKDVSDPVLRDAHVLRTALSVVLLLLDALEVCRAASAPVISCGAVASAIHLSALVRYSNILVIITRFLFRWRGGIIIVIIVRFLCRRRGAA